jgi:hypothetical protein
MRSIISRLSLFLDIVFLYGHSPNECEKEKTRVIGDLLDAARHYWFRGPVVSEIAEFNESDFSTLLSTAERKDTSREYISQTLLTETAPPELYQVYQWNLLFEKYPGHRTNREVEYLSLKAAFTMKARDAESGINDFKNLNQDKKAFCSHRPDTILRLAPLQKFWSYGDHIKLGSVAAKYFLEKYFAIQDFSLIGLEAVYVCGIESIEDLLTRNFESFPKAGRIQKTIFYITTKK